jgi:hypothetical protein
LSTRKFRQQNYYFLKRKKKKKKNRKAGKKEPFDCQLRTQSRRVS